MSTVQYVQWWHRREPAAEIELEVRGCPDRNVVELATPKRTYTWPASRVERLVRRIHACAQGGPSSGKLSKRDLSSFAYKVYDYVAILDKAALDDLQRARNDPKAAWAEP